MADETTSDVDNLHTDTEFTDESLEEIENETYIEEEEPEIYNSEDFISGPTLSENSTIPLNILEFDYSYGYDCHRYFNLTVVQEDTVVYASGNLINFFNVTTKEHWFRRSYLGGGIGHITNNHQDEFIHLTVAENGDNPPIIIYEWPSLDIFGLLKGGASKRFSHLNYSPDGLLLVSQSAAPDFLITVWDWQRRKIILRTKSHVNNVHRVMFSPFVPGHITTCGAGHIKFWKMAQTFTGLKLQGELGRFGKTEISDIIGILPMVDEKVLSGSEWGNILVWEEGLIKFEVYRAPRIRCHEDALIQFEFYDNELWTIAMDGWCRCWNYKHIDEADPPDDDRVVPLVPVFERPNPDVKFLCAYKRNPSDDFKDPIYYAQDGNGGIWEIDLTFRYSYKPSVKLFTCHAGPVADMVLSPWSSHIVTLGVDKKMLVYNYKEKSLVYIKHFSAQGRCLMWLPMMLDPSGSILIGGFDDGMLRIIVIDLHNDAHISIKTIQHTKPHNKPVTAMSMNESNTILVTGGEDSTIFIFCINYNLKNAVELIPVGFIPTDSIVTCLSWNLTKKNTVLVGCLYGEFMECEVPAEPQDYTTISYLLNLTPQIKKFKTCKAQIRRDIKIKEIEEKKARKLEKKKQELEKLKSDNPGLNIDEELFLVDSDSEEELEPLHIPEIPNKIWFAKYTKHGTIWLSMGGYDAGYIYEYTMDQTEETPLQSTIIHDGDDIEIHNYLYSPDGQYLIFSQHDGKIRINRVNPDDFYDLKDYWILSTHDNFNGRVSKMCFSYDYNYFFTVGYDGNIFAYKFNSETPFKVKVEFPIIQVEAEEIFLEEGYSALSLEEMKIKKEYDRKMKVAKEHKEKLLSRLQELKEEMTKLLVINCGMPVSQRFSLKTFIIDDRIMDAFEKKLSSKIELEKRKLAYDLEKSTIGLTKLKNHFTNILDVFPITIKSSDKKISISTLPQRALGEEFYDMKDIVDSKIAEEELKNRMPESDKYVGSGKVSPKRESDELEPFLAELSPSTIAFRLGTKVNRLLRRYRERKLIREQREEEWDILNKQKPAENANHPDDEKALEIAEKTIGDYKLKSSADYKVPKELNENTVKKYQELLLCRQELYKMKHDFNIQVYDLRSKKVELVDQLNVLVAKLENIHKELPKNRIKEIPKIPKILDSDFPENKFNVSIIMNNKKDKSKKKKKANIIAPEKHYDAEYEILNITKHSDIRGNLTFAIASFQNRFTFDIDAVYKMKHNENMESIETIWEKEMKIKRFVKKLIEQDQIIKEIKTMIQDFDKEMEALKKTRIRLTMNTCFMELHLLVLHQELVILKDFETVETQLQQIVEDNLAEVQDIQNQIKQMENKIKAMNKEMEVGLDRTKELQQEFELAAKENKFWDFLKRIYKKKYKPPKIVNPDESESSSFSSDFSSESEEMEEAASLDSADIGPIRLDENICPKGCDKDLYELTFELRSQRHEIEKTAREYTKLIETIRKDIEGATKKFKIAYATMEKSEENLESYQREKQQKLNEVKRVIMLKFDQIQNLKSKNDFQYLSNVLVFSRPILRKLYKRHDELQHEILVEQTKHQQNKIHLHRMNVDINHMKATIKELREEIKESMLIKFGDQIDILEMEEAVLQELILRLRLAMMDIGALFHDEIIYWKNLHREKQLELKHVIRENTARYEILTTLHQEKLNLGTILYNIKKKKDEEIQSDTPYENNIEKLTAISQAQLEQIEALKAEIKMLSMKSVPHKAIAEKENIEVVTESPEEHKKLFEDFDSFEKMFLSNEADSSFTDFSMTYEQKITEEQVEYCAKELLTEMIDEIMNKADITLEDKFINTVSAVIENLPFSYVIRKDNMKFLSDRIKKYIRNKSELNESNVINKIHDITKRKNDEIEQLVSEILNNMFAAD